VVIPTYNSEKILPLCLESIRGQDYPEGKLEIIVVDGGSEDDTLEIAREYTDKIFSNPLKTGEAGKAVGVKKAEGDIIALIDSDNILPDKDWLKNMVEPFEDEEIAGTEPLFYTHRKKDCYITRYCALIGMNDPLCLFLGNYDRYCLLTGRWTGLDVKQEDAGDYLKIELDDKAIPTIGANGFLIRRELLKLCSIDDYLFDIDIVYELVSQGKNKFAKVKTGIIHIFSGSISTFARKQRRRIKDYAYYNQLGLRRYPWSEISKKSLIKFLLYDILVIPLIVQALKGYTKKRDLSWFFHMPACWVTLVVYGWGTIRNAVNVEEEDRGRWSQV
ncbi:MAG: glycosyltransferase, partial [Thermotogota bacterium]|nr:glycosyltransferase [Thermotogota bacterium]